MRYPDMWQETAPWTRKQRVMMISWMHLDYPWWIPFCFSQAAGVCEWYESKSIPGITYCIANTKNVLAGSFDDLFELFNAHNAVFLAKSNSIYRLRLDDEHFHSLLIWSQIRLKRKAIQNSRKLSYSKACVNLRQTELYLLWFNN